MKHVYLAGPFFSNEQVARLKQVERSLAENPQPLAVYSLRLYQEGSSEPNTPERAREIFEKRHAGIDTSRCRRCRFG